MPESIFTKIINREIPAKIIYEDENFIAFYDLHPKAPVHALIVTKQPYASLEEIPLEDQKVMSQILLVTRKVAQQLGISSNYKIAMNVGERVQEVQHFHLHLLGGWPKLSSPSDAEVGF